MITLTRRYTFESAHRLAGLREGHKCARLHGHNYALEVTIGLIEGAELDDAGMIVDAEALDVFVRPVIKDVDHRYLNELMSPEHASPLATAMMQSPTAERIVDWLWDRLQFLNSGAPGRGRLARLRLYENADIWVERTA